MYIYLHKRCLLLLIYPPAYVYALFVRWSAHIEYRDYLTNMNKKKHDIARTHHWHGIQMRNEKTTRNGTWAKKIRVVHKCTKRGLRLRHVLCDAGCFKLLYSTCSTFTSTNCRWKLQKTHLCVSRRRKRRALSHQTT